MYFIPLKGSPMKTTLPYWGDLLSFSERGLMEQLL